VLQKMNSFYDHIIREGRKRFGLLIDPDKHTPDSLAALKGLIRRYPPDLILVGGSLLFEPIDPTVQILKEGLDVPVFLFPGDVTQLSDHADGIFFLSLISGRNPQYLIGNHVIAAPRLRRLGMEVIPTAYLLVENGHSTSVEYVSDTKPIPAGKSDLAVATAMAGEMLGMKLIYLESGSGAARPVGLDMIRAIKKETAVPLFVGGGIRTVEEAEAVYNAGADLIVVGTALEEYPEQLKNFAALRDTLNRE
jgi:putative glycerol-1-phosphate prenyltransferase